MLRRVAHRAFTELGPPAAAIVGALLLVSTTSAADGRRPRPTDVPSAETSLAPNGFQIYNDFASPETTYSSRRVVVHFVRIGIDAPPLNDDDGDGVPDYVQRVGEAADQALAYYERRGFHAIPPDVAGPDGRPDIYISRFAPGTFGVTFPAVEAAGGAFVVVANNLDPSVGRSLASLYATVAHELFHLTQFSYFGPTRDPVIPAWIMEGTAAAMEARVYPDLEDIVTTIQMRSWFSATSASITTQSYGAQLFWERLDTDAPRFLPALFAALAAGRSAAEDVRLVGSVYARVTGTPLSEAFTRYAIAIARDEPDRLAPAPGPRAGTLAPLSVRYLRSRPRTRVSVTFARGHAGAAALVYRIAVNPGDPPRTRVVRPRLVRRTLTFTVTGSAVLVLANGTRRAVPYVYRVLRAPEGRDARRGSRRR